MVPQPFYSVFTAFRRRTSGSRGRNGDSGSVPSLTPFYLSGLPPKTGKDLEILRHLTTDLPTNRVRVSSDLSRYTPHIGKGLPTALLTGV